MKKFRNILALLVCLFTAAPSSAWIHGANQIFQNLGGVAGAFDVVVYYTNVRPTTNWAIAGGGRTYNLSAGGSATMQTAYGSGYIDTNGELLSGSAINAITSVNVPLFTVPVGISNPTSDPPVGPISATFQGTIATTTLTVTSITTGALQLYDTVTGPNVTGENTSSVMIGNAVTNSGACSPACTGNGSTGTYALNESSTVSSAVAMTTRTSWWTGLPMTISWIGTGVSSVSLNGSLGSGGTALSCGANSCTFAFGYNPTNVDFSFNFTAGSSSPPTKIQIYETANATRMASCAGGSLSNCFAPDWLAQVGPIGIKRYMNWMGMNTSNWTDISQLADFNYTVFAGSSNGCSGGGTGQITISGTTATVTGQSTALNLYSGMTLVDATGSILASGTTLTSGTGGGNGSYSVNPSQTVSAVTFTGATSGASTTLNATGASGTPLVGTVLSGTNIPTSGGSTTIIGVTSLGAGAYTITMDRASSGTVSGTVTATPWFLAYSTPGTALGTGAKCAVHPSIAVALANATHTDVHYNITPTISDAAMTAIATYFFNNLNSGLHVWFEVGNEDWNGDIGTAYYTLQNMGWSRFQNGTANLSEAGYIASHLFNLVSAVYGPSGRSRWKGMVTGQLTGSSAAPSAFVGGFNAWNSDNSAGLNVWNLFDTVEFAPYVTDTMTISGSGTLYNIINDSVACYNTTVGATISSGSITGNALTATVGSGTLLAGQTIGGQAGIPAFTYVLPGGSGGSWSLSNSVSGTVTGTMATTPCPTRYSWFAREYSESLITGTNDYSYNITGTNFVNGLTSAYQANQLYAVSQGLNFQNYEGYTQIFTSGSDALGEDFYWNWKYDAANNDPNYSAAKIADALIAQQTAVHSGFSSIYTIDGSMGTFGQWTYPTDTNAAWTEILAKNAAGPYVDPTPVATWSVNYNSSTDRSFASGGSTSLTCPYTAPAGGGLAVILTSQSTSAIPSQVQIDSNTPISVPDSADTTNAWRPSIWSQVVTAGSHTITVTWPSSVSFRNCAVLTLQNLTSNVVESAGTSGQNNQTINITKGSFIISVATPPNTSGVTWQANSTPSGQISGCPSACSNVHIFDYEASNSQLFAFAYWSQGPPFSSAIFAVKNSLSNGMATAAYK